MIDALPPVGTTEAEPDPLRCPDCLSYFVMYAETAVAWWTQSIVNQGDYDPGDDVRTLMRINRHGRSIVEAECRDCGKYSYPVNLKEWSQ